MCVYALGITSGATSRICRSRTPTRVSRARSPLPRPPLCSRYTPLALAFQAHTCVFSLSRHAVLIGTDSALAFLPPRPRTGHPHAHPGQSHDRHPRICELSCPPQTASPFLRPRGKVRGTTQRSSTGRAHTTRGESFFVSFRFVLFHGALGTRSAATCVVSICCLRTERVRPRLRTRRRERTDAYESG